MSFEIRITLPEELQEETRLNEDTVLRAFFEDGTLVIQERGKGLNYRSFDGPLEVTLPCHDCDYFCPVHDICPYDDTDNTEEW